MEVLFRYTAIMVQPCFGVAPESFNSIDVSVFSSNVLFPAMSNDLMMLANQIQCGIRGMVV